MYFLSASIIAFVVGLVHTVLGEVLIFRKMRRDGLIPTDGGSILKESNVRILWASWHVLTIFGWGIAYLLLWLARQSMYTDTHEVLGYTVLISMFAGAVLVLFGTKAKHPGWVGLLAVSLLTWFGTIA